MMKKTYRDDNTRDVHIIDSTLGEDYYDKIASLTRKTFNH